MMMVSIMLMGELSVAVDALPALPSTLSTSGTDLMSRSCTCRMRFASVLEISGRVTGMKRMLCSSSGGMNSVPRLFSRGTAMISAAILMARVVFRHLSTTRMTGSYIFSRTRVTGLALSGLNFPFMKMEIRAGARVITSSASTIMMNVLVNASGWNSLPSCPVSRNTGRKEVMMITVAKNTPRDTCLPDLAMISSRSSSLIQEGSRRNNRFMNFMLTAIFVRPATLHTVRINVCTRFRS